MKNKFILVISCIVFLALYVISFTSCDRKGSSDTDENNPGNTTAHEPVFSCYLDSDIRTVTAGNVDASIGTYYETANLNNELHITVNLHNRLSKTNRVKFTDIRVIRESNGSSYAYKTPVSIEINADLKDTVRFSFEIPTSIQEDHYYLEFKINKSLLRYYLYITPDELLESHTVTYLIDEVVVHEEQVLHGKDLPDFAWFSENGLYYCIKWSNEDLDAFYKDYAHRDIPYKVKNDMTLEGDKKEMLQYMTTSSDAYAFAQQLNQDGVVPPNKTLVIPAKHGGKPIRISNFFFDSRLKDIEIVYIPNTDRIYAQSLSKTKIKEIHFAGSEEEWKALDVDVPSRITIYYNSKFKEP